MIVLALFSAALSLWVGYALATPRSPHTGNEVAELVYSRMLGNRDVIAVLAILATGAAFFAAILTAIGRYA